MRDNGYTWYCKINPANKHIAVNMREVDLVMSIKQTNVLLVAYLRSAR